MDKLALLGEDVVAALMAFYFRLAIIHRDIENSITEAGEKNVPADYARLIATRFARALMPGKIALESMREFVPKWESIEASALKAVAEGQRGRGEGTFRDRLAEAIKLAVKVE